MPSSRSRNTSNNWRTDFTNDHTTATTTPPSPEPTTVDPITTAITKFDGFTPEQLRALPTADVPAPPRVSGSITDITRAHPTEPIAARTDLPPSRAFRAPDGSMFLTDDTGRVSWVITTKGTKPHWNPELSQPQPNTVYLADGRYLFVTDTLARTTHRDGILGLDPRTNREATDARHEPTQRAAGTPDRRPGDVGSHGFGRKFQGPAETINLDALTAEINSNKTQQYGHLERQWEKLLTNDHPPRIRVKQWIEYPGDSRRPDTFSVEYTIHNPDGHTDGPYTQEFYND